MTVCVPNRLMIFWCQTVVSATEAANYITKLPEEEASRPEWQAAIEALILVVDLGGPTMFVRIGVMRALNRHGGPVTAPRRKRAKAYRIVR